MRSTFMGLEASKRGLYTQQSALYTTGHNVSNANTEGYSRQRVNMAPTLGYPGVGLTAPKTAGFIGTGVQAESVQRIRDEFIDRQYRQETNKLGYWESRTNAINQMEDILTEPSEYGLDEAFRKFWNALQDVSTNPEDAAARRVAIQRAEYVADSFNYINTQLKQIQGNLGNEIDVSTTQVNSILKQIAEINEQIMAVEPNGYMPNDLYDARDKLIDELNEYLPVSITREKSGGNALAIAEGSYTVTYKDTAGNDIVLVKGKDYVQLSAMGVTDDGNGTEGQISSNEPYKYFTHFKVIDSEGNEIKINYSDLQPQKGKLISLIDSYGYTNDNGTTVEGYYSNIISQLNKLAKSFADTFNKVHQEGYTLDGNKGTNKVFEFDDTTKKLKVLISNPNDLAAASAMDEPGNGKWAIELANLQSKSISSSDPLKITVDGTTIEISISESLDGATFQTFYKSLIGKLGVDGQEAERLRYNSETLRLTVENNRASMSSVSLDEEMTDMIRFQQAYNANARMITVIDETLDKIINGMGRVGL